MAVKERLEGEGKFKEKQVYQKSTSSGDSRAAGTMATFASFCVTTRMLNNLEVEASRINISYKYHFPSFPS